MQQQRSMYRGAIALLFVLFFVAGVCPSPAQESRGTILGRVTDATGGVIPNAEVRAVNVATQATAVARTNDAGNYVIPYLLPGTYTITFEAQGFRKSQRENVQVRVNDSLELNVQLQVGAVTEAIEVVAETPLLETANASLGQVVDRRRVSELPIQSGNAFELVLLAPGVMNATDMRLRKPGWNNAPSQIMTDGNPQYSNEFTIDGVANTFSSGTQPRVAFSPPQSAISEFKVQTSSFDASLGHTPGSVINVSTTSGTNALHGELHYWHANSAFDAYDLFQKAAKQKKPVYQDNRYGFSLGGPVYIPKTYNGRNKTFWFYAWEANKWGVPCTFTGTVPTEAQRNGDFSRLLAQGSAYQIYDPATIRDAGGGRFSRDPFAGNIIPPVRLDPVAKNMLKYWAPPNQAGTSDGRNNYTTPTKAFEDYFVHLARMDHNFSEKHRAFLRLHYDWWEEDKDDQFNNLVTGIVLHRINRGLALDDVLVLTPTSILNLRYGLTQQEFPEWRRSRGFDLASLGFSPKLTALVDQRFATFPRVDVGAYSGFANWESGDGSNTSMVHSFNANLSVLKGNHNLRYGAEFRLYREFGNRFQYDVAPYLSFDTTWTRGPFNNSPGSSIGQDLAALLLGRPGGEMRRSASYAEQESFWAFYIQDDWKVTPKLTVNVGLRYEYETPLTERYDRAVKGFAYGVSNPIEAQARANYAKSPIAELPVDAFRTLGGLTFAGGASGRSFWQGEKNNFMPRLGIAYQITPKTILRTGYGMFFETIGSNRSSSIQTGFTQRTPVTITQNNGLTFIGSTADPFPFGLQEPLGAKGGLATALGQSLSFYPLQRLQPYAQRWSFGIQRQFPGEVVVDVAWVGNRGTRLAVSREINPGPRQYLSRSPERDDTTINFLTQQVTSPFFGLDPNYTSVTMSRANLLRPYPHFSSITRTDPIGYSWYHSLQVRGEKRFARGYTLQAAYTFSKLMEAIEFLNESDPMPYEVVSSFDRPHRLAASGIFELPFGKGRRFASTVPGWANQVIGGWQLSILVQRQAGAPLGFGNAIFRGNIKDIPLPKDQRSLDRWFNIDAGFERDSRKQLASNLRTFPLRFSGIRGDGQARWDISAIKYFPIRERFKLQFRAECYNAWNHPNFASPNPNTTPTSSAFGTIRTTVRYPRQFQLALKLTF